MKDKEFEQIYCSNCGAQRCEGLGTEWFECCKYRWNHDSYDAAAEIERLNQKIMELAREPQKNKGKWIRHWWTTEDDWGCINHTSIECTACGTQICHGVPTEYCPHCGAEMEEGTGRR